MSHVGLARRHRASSGLSGPLAALAVVAAACSAAPTPGPAGARGAAAPLSLAAEDRMVVVPAGRYIRGSTPEERATAYEEHFGTAGHDTARTEKWFDREADRTVSELPAFRIDSMPVTQAQYAEIVLAGQARAPSIDSADDTDLARWRAQGVTLDVPTLRARLTWRDGRPPDGREDHPVVLVSWNDAERYCGWRGALRGEKRRLPTAEEFEKAARGTGGMAYPWGNVFEADKLNSAAGGPGDTMPVGTYPAGASPFGLLDMAGNVLHWTATPAGDNAMVVKGSGWTAFAGVGRGAWLDRRARTERDLAVGFRCAADAP
jgi:formylglycine-generating enzyme required for sulfatase activity